ncbi:MAG: nicotinate-nucleotide adenylyltransferase [Paraglaciecola sp.]|nr:nicotinate-nucleotide adenylyltransferase [Paraglaciecola sp.]
MSLAPAIGLFGGTFDPIHNGHIEPVMAAAKQVNLQTVALMPNYLPAHKAQALSSSAQRLDMIKRVCDTYPLFYPEPWEIEQARVTYSVDTLSAFRDRHPNSPICFFIGTDSLNSLPTWHRWETLLNLCHFIVCKRNSETTKKPTTEQQKIVADLLRKHQTTEPASLHRTLAGHIYLADTPEVNVSSTKIRALIAQGYRPHEMLPESILQYIEYTKLYQPKSNI